MKDSSFPHEQFDELLAANADYVKSFKYSELSGSAAKGLAIVTCMDSRINPLSVMGLKSGDAKILRNAGARVTEDVLRTLVLATYLLGVNKILVMPHTNCRMAEVDEAEIHQEIDSKFGISIHQTPHILRIVKNTGMRINGIHMHTGSDILDIEVFLYASEILFETAKNFKNLDFIDFGSGFKVPYKEGDIETNIEELGDKLSKRFNDFCEQYGKPLTLAFEPGKFLVSEAGSFLAKVNVVKQTTSTVFASIDSGFNHLIRPMLYGSTHGINNISNPSGRERFYSVVGYICETDTFATNRKIAEITEGDILCFKNAGAYCFTMASNYNSRFRPAEVLWYMGEAHLIRAAETMEDIMRNQIDVKDLFSQKVNEVLQPN